MKVLGINAGETSFGKKLKDGGACLLADQELKVAIAEERITRQKSEGGYSNSISYCVQSTNLELDDIDQIIFSTCCEFQHQPALESINESTSIETISHHYSHAHHAFCHSPFEEAIILVLDAGGNTLDPDCGQKWWECAREQQSYYLADGEGIDLLHRDFEEQLSAGVGELYRAFTHFLGFGSYVNSGKTMGLAAYGNADEFDIDLLHLEDGKMKSRTDNDPMNPVEMVKRFSESNGLNFGPPRRSGSTIRQSHKDIACYIQEQLEDALTKKVKSLIDSTDCKNVVFAGGVALNCVANKRILDNTAVEGLFVPPAAGDQGQCIGNVLYGYHNALGDYSVDKRVAPFPWKNPYLGRDHELNAQNINKLTQSENTRIKIVEPDNIFKTVSNMIADGHVVGWFQGRCEFGPRALGNRSLLADPTDRDLLPILNRIKSRMEFRPYAPSILEEYVEDWFVDDWLLKGDHHDEYLSSLMTVIAEVTPSKRNEIPTVVHEDGTSRLQVVSKEANRSYYNLIKSFHEVTEVPILLNTSLNRGGKPLCETPNDAIQLFLETELPTLVIGNVLLRKKY